MDGVERCDAVRTGAGASAREYRCMLAAEHLGPHQAMTVLGPVRWAEPGKTAPDPPDWEDEDEG